MTYMCDLGAGIRVYLDNQAQQTLVTVISSGPGQQQQSSSSFQTGTWTSEPQVFPGSGGATIRLSTEGGDRFLQIQGTQMSMSNTSAPASQHQAMTMQRVESMPSMPAMQPMEPMKMEPMKMEPMKMEPMKMEPMKMGNMEMSASPMQMKMGNMEMKMGEKPSTSPQRKFCSQCGAPVKPDDRFCSSCGHRLD